MRKIKLVLYNADDGSGARQWMEAALPFQQILELSGAAPSNVPDVEIDLSSASIEAKADYDGEPRLLGMEAVLELSIRIWS